MKHAECSDEKGTTIVSNIQMTSKVIETVIKTQTGGSMKIVTDLDGTKIKQTGDLQLKLESESVWTVSIKTFGLPMMWDMKVF